LRKIPGLKIGSGKVALMVVLPCPSLDEHEAGRALAGGLGELTRDLMKEHGITGTCWFTYACNEHLGMRKPSKGETDPTRLRTEMLLHNPEVVALLGQASVSAVLDRQDVAKIAGVPIRGGGRTIFPMTDPSVVLAKEQELRRVNAQFLALRAVLEQTADPKSHTEVVTVRGEEEAKDLFKNRFKTTTAFDYETAAPAPDWDAVNPHKGRIRCVALTDEVGKAWVLPETLVSSPIFADWLRGPTRKVAHNAIFEKVWSRVHFGKWPEEVVDTLAMHHLLDENLSHSLDACVAQLAPELYGYDAEMSLFLAEFTEAGEGFFKAKDELLHPYCGRDADATLRIFRAMSPHFLKDEELGTLNEEIVQPSSHVLSLFAFRGMCVRQDKLEEAHAALIRKFDACTEALQKSPEVKRCLMSMGLNDFNPASPKQVSHLLFKTMKMKSVKATKAGGDSVSSEVIRSLPANKVTESLVGVADVKGLMNTATTYRKHLRKDSLLPTKSVISSWYSNSQVVTGRLNCRVPNLQAIPSGEEEGGIGSSFVSRLGGCLVKADYAQLELRLLAFMTREKAWLDGFAGDGWDPHQATADSIGEERAVGKRLNFGIVYGIGAKKLAAQVNKSKAWAVAKLDEFWTKHRAIKDWFEDQHALLRRKGQLRTPAGRLRRLSAARDYSDDDPRQWRAMRQGPNFVIQGFAADLVALAMVQVEDALSGMRSLLVNQCHDALVVECCSEEEKEVAEILSFVMSSRAPARFGVDVPLVVDVKAVPHL
jgi:DNA polymerase I-like protein with 3'-5' exonuclease and polymerase domains/uracil-DNA glycosylase